MIQSLIEIDDWISNTLESMKRNKSLCTSNIIKHIFKVKNHDDLILILIWFDISIIHFWKNMKAINLEEKFLYIKSTCKYIFQKIYDFKFFR